jgi:diguanylate cyclase (GGDEF)-like protein
MERSFYISKKEYMKAKTRIVNLDFIDNNTTDERKIFDLVKEYREQGSLYDRAYFLLMYSLIAYYQGYVDQSQKLRVEFESIENPEVREKFKNDLNLVNLIANDTKESLMEALNLSIEHQEDIIISKYHINTVLGSHLLKQGMKTEAAGVLLENLNRFETVVKAIGYDKLGHRHRDFYMLDLVIPLIDSALMEAAEVIRDFEPGIDNYLAHMSEKSYQQIFGERKAPDCCVSVDQLLSKLDGNAGENLEKILQFLAVKTNSEIGYIEVYGRDAAERKIYKYNTENEFTLNLIVENTIKEGEPIVIKRGLSSKSCHMLEAHVDPELAGFMAVPIMIGQGFGDSSLERRQSITRNKVYGHILLLTRSNINRFDESRLSLAQDLTGLVYLNSENERLFRNSYYDRLTGTLRRNIVEKVLEEAIQHYSVNEKGFACMMVDIDRFKLVNDNYGHQAGDRVLSMIGAAIRNSIRRTDSAGRYGGEEFLLIIEDVDSTAAAAVAEKIKNTIENMKVKGIKQKITASIGISLYPDDGQMPEDLILRADQAMYYAKEVLGRNNIAVWKDGMEAIISSNKLDHDLLISGFASDADRIGALADAALLIGKKLPLEQKLNEFLGLIMDSTLGQIVEIYKYQNGEFVKLASRYKNLKSVNTSIPAELFKRVEKTCLSEHYIDWKFKQDSSEIPKSREFRSGAVCPMIHEGILFGLIFVESSLDTMEFKQKELKYIEVMGSVFSANLV